MTIVVLEAQFSFYGVGQGLFGTGRIRRYESTFSDFNWVYDCGTVSAKALLHSALSDLERKISRGPKRRPYIGLVTISHFDNDHINGLVALLESFEVGDLLLPYVPLWQRLVIAFQANRRHSSRLTRFLLDPAAFIAAIPEASVRRILYVPTGGQSPDTPSGDEPTPSPSKSEETTAESPSDLEFDPIDLDDLKPGDDLARDASQMPASAGKGISIEVVRPGSALVFAECWEFVPYNDAILAPRATPSFIHRVTRLRNELLDGTRASRTAALDELKTLYTSTFAGVASHTNLISLFLYAGPVAAACIWCDHPMNWPFGYPPCKSNGGVLYTGDGYLDTPGRFNALLRALGPHRVEHVTGLQVMHHGSAHNWHVGLAKKISPALSVFSSDPSHRRYRHPSADVVADFLPYRPMQADKTNTVSWSMAYWV